MYAWNDGAELYHYGIKGMKWGVRRSKEELARDRNSIYARVNNRILKHPYKTSNGIPVKGFSSHAADRAANRDEGKGPIITHEQIYSALTKPLAFDKVKIDSLGRKSQKFYGRKATVFINPDTGIITTVFHTGTDVLKRL